MAGIEKGVTLRHIVSVLYGAFRGESVTRPVLGRFGMIDCEKSVRYKSELANEDHCGTCATYVLQKQDEITSMQSRNMSTVRPVNSIINSSVIDNNINRVEKSVKFYNKETMKNNEKDDDDDDDDNNTSSGLRGMIVANNTVFVGPHTVHPQRKYTHYPSLLVTSINNNNNNINNNNNKKSYSSLIADFDENDEVNETIYMMLLSDMNNSIPSSNGSYYGNANKNTNTKSMYA